MCENGVEVVRASRILEIGDPHSVDVLTEQLRAAAEAHHRYQEATGDDDEWHRWYARHIMHMQPEVSW